MPEQPLNGDRFFDRWGTDGDHAFEILQGCTFPPSFEVFEYGLERVRDRARAPITVQRYARALVDNYARVE